MNHKIPKGFNPPQFAKCGECQCVTVDTRDQDIANLRRTVPVIIDSLGVLQSFATGQAIMFNPEDGDPAWAYFVSPSGPNHSWIAIQVENSAICGAVTPTSTAIDNFVAAT